MHLASALGVVEELISMWDGKFGSRGYLEGGKNASVRFDVAETA